MLETPMQGRFVGENRKLVVTAPMPYLAFVRGTGFVGAWMMLMSFMPVELPVYRTWWLMIGVMVLSAAVLAAFSIQQIVFDLRERVYRRRQGPGWIPRFSRGKLSDLDAVVVVSELSQIPSPSVTYHMVLHWKGNREPIMVLQREEYGLPPGKPLNFAAGQMVAVAWRYGQALGLNVFDNSHLMGKCPVPLWD